MAQPLESSHPRDHDARRRELVADKKGVAGNLVTIGAELKLFAAVLALTPLMATAQVYRCPGPDGQVVLQQTACSNDGGRQLKTQNYTTPHDHRPGSVASSEAPARKETPAALTVDSRDRNRKAEVNVSR